MATLKLHINDPEADDTKFSIANILYWDDLEVELTDEHSAASYALPVLYDRASGRVWGPGEIPSILVILDHEEIPDILYRAKAAGFRVKIGRTTEALSEEFAEL